MYSLDLYDFHLPPEQIAAHPVFPRDSSRLMVVHRAEKRWEHRRFSDLPKILDSHDFIVANSTRVIHARLKGNRVLPDKQGGKVEVFLLKFLGDQIWECAFHASVKGLPGVRFTFVDPQAGSTLNGEIVRGSVDSVQGTIEVRFDRDPLESGLGEIPLPPYLKRPPVNEDEKDYQTIYAKQAGSVAAPTAGLHFTPELVTQLKSRGVGWANVVLNIGLGTFRPVKSDDIREHQMSTEEYEISSENAELVSAAKSSGKRIVAVGTTSVRTLESAWQAGQLPAGRGSTALYIYPGNFRGEENFQVVDRLITNFHLPKSTLLMLVSAFIGRELTLAAYQDAVREGYRFLSYGDAMLVL